MQRSAPVVRIAYNVEAARVEQRTDLDKLVIDMETNGTLDRKKPFAAQLLFWLSSWMPLLICVMFPFREERRQAEFDLSCCVL